MKNTSLVLLALAFISFILFYNPSSIIADENISDTSVVLVIDMSSSMWGTPINNVKDATKNFVLSVDETIPIAIVTFANQAQVVQDYTTDRMQLFESINDLSPNGVTALYDGAMQGVNYAAQSTASNRVVILLSDGAEYGNQSQSTRDDAILYARSQDIIINSIGLGFGADRSYLEEIATQTNGMFYGAELEGDVLSIYTQLSDELLNSPSIPIQDVAQLSEITPLPSISANRNVYTFVNDSIIEPVQQNDEVAVEPAQEIVSSFIEPGSASVETVPIDVSTKDTAIVLTIDVSQSMWGTPINSTIEAIEQFILNVDPNIPIAIVTFSNEAQLIQDFTTDKTLLLQTVGSITPYGVTALYDGALLAVEVAAESEASNPVVLLLSDGGEYGGQSKSERDDALLMAQTLDVSINTVAFGFGVDRTYLETLSLMNNGDLYEVENREGLLNVYADLSEQFEAGNVIQETGNTNELAIAPLNIDSETSQIESSLPQPEFPLNSAPIVEDIVPLDNEIASLNLNEERSNSGSIGAAVGSTTTDTNDIVPAELEQVEVDPMANIMPVNVSLADNIEIESASVYINNYEIASFTEAPFSFDLDTLLLTTGRYNFVVEVRTSNDVTSEGMIPFDVTLVTPELEVATVDESDTNATTSDSSVSTTLTQASAVSVVAERILTINGQEQPFNFEYSPLTGLTLQQPVISTVDLAEAQNLGQVLLRPLQLVPEPVLDYIMTPRPRLTIAIIIIMTLILLPQGLFTIYWMTYTWVNPDRLEKSASPKEFSKPQHSFTSLLPARKEAAVIYDTIMTINRIDYPEHLKETLVLIRDEDDDDTIAATERAIQDIRQSYWDRGEEYPDNVHLVTFTDGPYNKPNGLNRGYAVATKEVICIFDAEDQPHHDIYNVVNTVMIRDNADVVQSGVQLMNFKSKWFSAFNVLEYFFWFKSGLHAFTHELGVTPLGGNTVFFKKNWLDIFAKEDLKDGYRVWDEQGLTEDGDIGLRLTQMGANIQIVYDAVQATQEETPDSVEQFVKQRTRWNQGFYQIFAKGLWRQLPTFKQRITAVYILLNSLLQASIMLFLPIGLFIALTQEVPVPIAMISYLPIYILIMQLVLNMVGIREFTEAYGLKIPLFFRLKMLGWFYPFQLMLSFSALRAVKRFITNQSSWEKTTHSNLHREASRAIPAPARA